MQAIILEKTGEASNLKLKEIAAPTKFKKTDVLIRQTAVGVNFLDVCFRRGQYKISQEMPAILGYEGCGVVEAVGSQVLGLKVGQRVAYGLSPLGAYAGKRVISSHLVAKVPDYISDTMAAGSILKGLMAHTLLFRVYIAKHAKRILVHSAAGGLGQFLCQWARHLGVEVIGSVGSASKVQAARDNGCSHVIDRSQKDFVAEVAKITGKAGVGMVLDGVGRDTLVNSLKCLWPMGLCASYGDTSGDVGAIDVNYLAKNATYLTRPTLSMYKSNQIEMAFAASEVFDLIKTGALRPKITEYAFKDAAKAHQDLESGKTVGSLVLKL